MIKEQEEITFKIAPMKKEDVPAVVRMMRGLIRYHDESYKVTASFLEKHALGRSAYADVKVVFADKKPIGFVLLHDKVVFIWSKNLRYINLMFIEEKYRQFGLGADLIGIIAAETLADGYDELQVEARKDNKVANAFYKKVGFAISKLKPNKKNNDYVMDKKTMKMVSKDYK